LLIRPLFNNTGLDSDVPTKPNFKMMDVNVYGVFYTAKLAAHYFARQPEDKYDRCLILIGSVMSYLDTYGAVGYGLSKHAVRGLMGVLRRRGLMRVNMLAPWWVKARFSFK
jgi:NAD(P)-dependent dehydrogenase (short-subunit alcohol dehydrogenase family)